MPEKDKYSTQVIVLTDLPGESRQERPINARFNQPKKQKGDIIDLGKFGRFEVVEVIDLGQGNQQLRVIAA